MLTDDAKGWLATIAWAGAWITIAAATVGHWGWRDGMALVFAFNMVLRTIRRAGSPPDGDAG